MTHALTVSGELQVLLGGGYTQTHKSTMPILHQKTVFDSSGHKLFEYVAKFGLKFTDDVAGQAKDQLFFFTVLAGFAGQSSRIQLKQSRCNGMDRIWNVFKLRHSRPSSGAEVFQSESSGVVTSTCKLGGGFGTSF